MTIQLSSSAFQDGGMIPKKHSKLGEDCSPPLEWSNAPDNTKTFALICDDPDAPRTEPWVHWVIFNIPGNVQKLEEGMETSKELANGARHGKNDFGDFGYGGPKPPSGTHRYYFKLYALDSDVNLPAGISKDQLLAAMKGHVLEEGELMGKYAK